MKENIMGYSDEWQPYKNDYDKFEYDIKLFDGEVIENCYPNGGNFTPLETNDHYDGRDVKEIRFSNNPKSYLNMQVSEKTKTKLAEQDKNEIAVIYNEQTPKVEPVKNPESFGKENKELFEQIVYHLGRYHQTGIGLAANQASKGGKRIMDRFFVEKDLHTKEWSMIINPEIVERIGMVDNSLEGCLTWGKNIIYAKRYRRIKVSYYTADGEFKEELITGFRAYVWQHEINHLDGVIEDILTPAIYAEQSSQFTNPKIQRNDICPCGSGLKYKKCCGPFEIQI